MRGLSGTNNKLKLALQISLALISVLLIGAIIVVASLSARKNNPDYMDNASAGSVSENVIITLNSNTYPNTQKELMVKRGSEYVRLEFFEDRIYAAYKYTQIGWSTDKNATSPSITNYLVQASENIELWAVWEETDILTNIDVYLDAGYYGSGISILEDTVYAGDSYTFPNSPTFFDRSGYYIDGWAVKFGGAKIYDRGQTITINATDDGTITFYAHWAPEYTLTYNTNGGTGGPSPLTVNTVRSEVTISSDEPTKTGYTFLGWSTRANATSEDSQYDPGRTVTLTENTTIYAVWYEEYYIRYKSYDGSATAHDPQYTEYHRLTVASDTNLTREHYDLVGWTDNTKTYNLGQTYTFSSDTTLYEVWEKTAYDVRYSANGGTGNPPSSQSYHYGETVTVKSNPCTMAYTLSFNLSGQSGTTPANRSVLRETLSYWLDGSNNRFDAGSSYGYNDFHGSVNLLGQYSETAEVKLNSLPKGSDLGNTKYTLIGWTLVENGDKDTIITTDFNITENTTLYAVWGTGVKVVLSIDVENSTTLKVDVKENGQSIPAATQYKEYILDNTEAITKTDSITEDAMVTTLTFTDYKGDNFTITFTLANSTFNKGYYLEFLFKTLFENKTDTYIGTPKDPIATDGNTEIDIDCMVKKYVVNS